MRAADEMELSEERLAAARAKLKGEELKVFDRSVEVAEGIKMILLAVDLACRGQHLTAEELREMASKMRRNNGTLEAWPFPETMNLASKRKLELDVMDAITDLVGARSRWREKKDEKPFATGADILQMMGEVGL